MQNNNSRRLFIRKSLIASVGVALFSQSTTATNLLEDTITHKNNIVDLRKSTFFGKHLTVKGKIFDALGVSTLNNATVEIWHLSPNSTDYTHNAKLNTNANGEYSIITDFPEKEEGKSRRIYFKVSHASKEYCTELIITETDAHISAKHWEENNQLGDNLFPAKEGLKNSSAITFNISI